MPVTVARNGATVVHMLRGQFTTVRVRRESGRLLSRVSQLSGVPVADMPAALVAALGGPERAAAEVLRRRAAALGLGGDDYEPERTTATG